MVATGAVHAQIGAVWRLESPRIVAAVARLLRDLGEAEELAQDALLVALERWPREGLPTNPGAWLMTVAKIAALDRLRHRAMVARLSELDIGRGRTISTLVMTERAEPRETYIHIKGDFTRKGPVVTPAVR